MKDIGLRSAARSVLRYVIEGMIWTGVAFGVSGEVVTEVNDYMRRRDEPTYGLDDAREYPDLLPMTPLSEAERAEWADLVERIQLSA